MMAVITKAVQTGYGMLSGVIASETVAKMSQGQLEDRLWWVADLQARGADCRDQGLARYYQQIAKNALTALAPSVLEQRTRGLRTKADLMGPSPQSDMLRRQADELEAANPMPPKRAVVRKAGDPVSADQTSLMALYDCTGQIFGVAEAEDIVPGPGSGCDHEGRFGRHGRHARPGDGEAHRVREPGCDHAGNHGHDLEAREDRGAGRAARRRGR